MRLLIVVPRLVTGSLTVLAWLTLLVCANQLTGVAMAQGSSGLPKQDPQLLLFVERALPWYPGSIFTVKAEESFHTPSGRIRLVTVERACDNKSLSGERSLLIDEISSTAWLGAIGRLPDASHGLGGNDFKAFVERFIPEGIEKTQRLRTTVVWDGTYTRTGAVIPIKLNVNSGYGSYDKTAAVTADGRFFVLGNPLPYDQNPVEYRRQLIAASKLVVWDHDSATANVEIVELSDFQCPGCKVKWSTIEEALKTYGSSVKHGMVNFPLTSIHPWAFRSACASWCVGEQDIEMVIGLKKLFYSLQREMTTSEVTATSRDFVIGQGLSVDTFNACYLKKSSLDAVHGQMGLGHRLGVDATPTYFINGWKVQVPDKSWLMPMIERLIEGKHP
jgi:protein-disulfide isomerase